MTNEEVLDMYVPGWREMDDVKLILRLISALRCLNPSLGESKPGLGRIQ